MLNLKVLLLMRKYTGLACELFKKIKLAKGSVINKKV